MDINITAFVLNEEPFDYSASVAERGANAGRDTWNNAKAEAARKPLLTTEEELQELRDHVQAMGFGEEVQGYGVEECNALFIQLISGDLREMGFDECDPEDFDWAECERRQSEGRISGNIFKTDGDQYYFTLDS